MILSYFILFAIKDNYTKHLRIHHCFLAGAFLGRGILILVLGFYLLLLLFMAISTAFKSALGYFLGNRSSLYRFLGIIDF